MSIESDALAILWLVANGGLVFPVSPGDALIIKKWAVTRADNLRTRRRYIEAEVSRLKIDMDLQWVPDDSDDEYQRWAYIAGQARDFMTFLDGVISWSITPTDYTVDMVRGFNDYVRWMREQHEFLLELQRMTQAEERKQKGMVRNE